MILPRIFVALFALAALAACHSEETRQKIDGMENGVAASDTATAATTTPAAPAAVARPFSQIEKTSALEFTYEWPVEAAAIPALVDRFTKDMETAHKDAAAIAAEDESSRKGSGLDFHGHEFSRGWTTAGQTPALLSLVAMTSAYTGGAHPNHGSTGLLWDRKANKEVPVASLFTKAASFNALFIPPWCKGIDQARLERRQGERMGGEFDLCPPLRDVAIVPADSDKDGKFDRIRFLADPYVAGPYAEGDYEVTFAIEPSWIAAMKPEWRSSFEPR